MEKTIPTAGGSGTGIHIINYKDDEGHGEAEASDKHGPVTYVPLKSVFTGHQQEGHTGGEQLPQAEEEAHDGHGAQT